MKPWIRAGFKVFFRNKALNGIENIPKGKPIIFASNHQCTFLDPIVISASLSEKTAFLTRGDIFSKPKVAKILASLRMLPIFRQREAADFAERNKVIFENCVYLLEQNESFIIFVEGSHGNVRKLRPLKKGFGRIAFEAEKKNNFDLDVHIVPVGLNYEDFYKSRRDVLINFGKPIKLRDYQDLYEQSPAKALNGLKGDLTLAMRDQLIDITSRVYYDTYNQLRDLCLPKVCEKMNLSFHQPLDNFKAEKKMIQAVSDLEENNPEQMESFSKAVDYCHQKIAATGLRFKIWNENRPTIFQISVKALILIIGLPIFIIGLLFNYLPYKIPVLFSAKKFKDPMFHSSVNWVGGHFAFSFYYLFLFLIIWLTNSFSVAIAITIFLGISGYIALKWWSEFQKIRYQIKYLSFMKNNEGLYSDIMERKDKIQQQVELLIGRIK